MYQAFLNPRLVGKRFDGHTVPLEMLKDFSALEEMVVEVAKWKFRQAHPDSKRVQRNFSQGLELHLAQIKDGSAIPAIVLVTTAALSAGNAQYFEHARVEIVAAIDQAAHGLSPALPNYLLSYFDRFGRSLRVDESIVFDSDTQNPISYTPVLRKRLVQLAQVETWTEEVALRGRIPAINQDKLGFQLQLRDGTKLPAPLTDQHLAAVLDAVNGYRAGAHVLLQGVVKKDRLDHMQAFETVEHISPLDPLDVTLRLAALAELKPGWLDGKGQTPDPSHTQWLAAAFEDNFDASLPLPYLYPTADGGIQAEWSISDWEASLEIDLPTKGASLQALNLVTRELHEHDLVLTSIEGSQQINAVLHQIGGGAA
ncbi:MAG: hypothetical protein IPH54_21485 [Rhodoferax sp.]|nr:hypothetical protein [Rhodoferax sp.]